MSSWSSDDLHLNNETSCAICKRSFGVRRRHRRRTCNRCGKKVCDNCCTNKRFDFQSKELVRTCDHCLKNEYVIRISHRINNLKLKSKRTKGIYIAKTLPSSREYQDGFVTNCRIIQINSTNVESCTAQQIANKLNIIKLQCKMTLDYTESEISIHDLKLLIQPKKSIKSMSVGLEPDSLSTSFPHEPELRSNSNINWTKSCPGSPLAMDMSFSFGDHDWDRLKSQPEYSKSEHYDRIIELQHDHEQKDDASDIKCAHEASIPDTTHASRQFCVVFEDRDWLKHLCLELRNGLHLFKNISKHDKSDVWGWYTVKTYDEHHRTIPIGCKLLRINGINLLNPSHWHQINRYLSLCTLPIALIFEAPHYLKSVPRSQHIQYQYDRRTKAHPTDTNTKANRHRQTIFMWWLQEGGFVFIILSILALIAVEPIRAFVYNRLYWIIISILCIPSVASNIIHWLFKTAKRNNTQSPHKIEHTTSFTVVNEHRLSVNLNHTHHKHNKAKKQKQSSERSEKKDTESEERKVDQKSSISPVVSSIDTSWERNLCHPSGSTEQWGSYGLGSSPLLHVRGPSYLADKIKVESKQALLKIGHIEVFEAHETIDCMAQNECSWFYRNRCKLPKHLFFFIFHLRLDSLSCSIVIYWYCDKHQYKELIERNSAIGAMAKEKGKGYFCIGSNSYDESGMFWNFINGDCQYRNDRLKMIARKEEGSWYLHIPSTPAIIGKKIPIIYYRAYDKGELNGIKSVETKSEQHESYEFNTLCHDDSNSAIKGKEVPCACGRCYWLDTEGEYPEYMELHFNPEAASPIARNTIKIASGVTKSLSWELHFLLEGQRNGIELAETVFANARISYIQLDQMIAFD
eukprot:114737_1